MLELHEAWMAIAEQVADNGFVVWICNITEELHYAGKISERTERQIMERVYLEAERQGAVLEDDGRPCSLWREVTPQCRAGRVARLQFITAELRRLAVA